MMKRSWCGLCGNPFFRKLADHLLPATEGGDMLKSGVRSLVHKGHIFSNYYRGYFVASYH